MTKPRTPKLVKCEQGPIYADGSGIAVTMWIATDSAGRKFADATKDKAEKMFHDYYHLKPRKEIS